MSPTRPQKIFISRTTAGLAELAKKVDVALRERGLDIIHQPDFGFEWRKIRHMLMEKIREADAVLCLVGPVYGFAPKTPIPEFRDPDTGREEYSYTQLEFLIARRLHKPIVTILVPDEMCTFARPDERGTAEQQKLQSDFIRDVLGKDEHVRHKFSSEADLLGAIRSRLVPIPDNLLPPPTPENIPFRSIGTVFTGRTGTLLKLRDSLVSASNRISQRSTVQLIHGIGGVGKTRLTVEYAHIYDTDYTARLFVRGGSPGALDESLASLAGLFILNLEEQDEKETEVRIAAVLRWLAAHPGYLLVIDNVDTDDARDHAVEVLARLPAGHVLITSRLHTWPGDILRTPLAVLSDTDSCDLLFKYRSSPKAPAPETDAADALAIDEMSLGAGHPNVAIRLTNLASLLQATNRFAEAEPMMCRALAILENSLGREHPNVAIQLNNLASLTYELNRFAEAESLMRRALAIFENSLGEEHPNVAAQLNNLAQLLRAANRLVEAEPLSRRQLEILLKSTRITGHQHPHLIDAMTNYATLLIAVGNTEEQAIGEIGVMLAAFGVSI
jgi:tetratricopeptide (TPR) repeat protein